MILDKLAAEARKRVAILKNQKSLDMIKSEAQALPKGNFVFEKAGLQIFAVYSVP